MMILGSQRDALINSLNLTEPMKKLTRGEFVHEELEFRCLQLKYSLEPEDFSPKGLNVVPLWESDLSITGFHMNEDNQPVFIQFYIEDPDDIEDIGDSVEELVNFMVEEYVESDFEEEVTDLLLNS